MRFVSSNVETSWTCKQQLTVAFHWMTYQWLFLVKLLHLHEHHLVVMGFQQWCCLALCNRDGLVCPCRKTLLSPHPHWVACPQDCTVPPPNIEYLHKVMTWILASDISNYHFIGECYIRVFAVCTDNLGTGINFGAKWWSKCKCVDYIKGSASFYVCE